MKFLLPSESLCFSLLVVLRPKNDTAMALSMIHSWETGDGKIFF